MEAESKEAKNYRQPRCQCRKCLSNRGNDSKFILMKYQARNGHLSAKDSFRHSCGNGAVRCNQRRQDILLHEGFRISVPLQLFQAEPYLEIRRSMTETNTSSGENDDDTDNMVVRMRKLISDYIHFEENIPQKTISGRNHFSLVGASRASALTTLGQCLTAQYPAHIGNIRRHVFQMDVMRSFHERSKSKAHDEMNQQNQFTQLTRRQKMMLLAQSGLSGVLVSKLMHGQGVDTLNQFFRSPKLLRAAHIITTRSHDANACEVLADNRYGCFIRLKGGTIPVIDQSEVSCKMEWVVRTYPDIIVRIESDISKLKRGFVSIDHIFKNAEYTEFIRNWLGIYQYYTRFYQIMNLPELNHMMVFTASCPKLLEMDFARCLGYSPFVRTFRKKIREFSNEGILSAFLTFIKIEPRMANEFLTPSLSTKRQTNSKSDIDNYVPSRCPILGPVKKEFQDFIPRLGDMSWDICRKWGGQIFKDIPGAWSGM